MSTESATAQVPFPEGNDAPIKVDPKLSFHSDHYLRHTARRLEHLASLRIPVAGLSILEVGAGIGDHSHYFIDRGCRITITEAREENLCYLKNRYPAQDVRYLDMECPTAFEDGPFDVVHCYGLLYHIKNPKEALEYLSQNTRKMMLLETCVSFGDDDGINLVPENREKPGQAISGTGCRPSRALLFRELQKLFEYVYLPKTQPCHEEFPLDWETPTNHKATLKRAVFIASREKLENDLLVPSLIPHQVRHE